MTEPWNLKEDRIDIEKWFGPDTKKQKRREDWLALVLFIGMVFYVVAFCMGWTSCPR